MKENDNSKESVLTELKKGAERKGREVKAAEP